MPSNEGVNALDYPDDLKRLVAEGIKDFNEEIDNIDWNSRVEFNFVPAEFENRLTKLSEDAMETKISVYRKRTRIIALLYGIFFVCISGIGNGLFFGLMALGVISLYNRIWAKNYGGKDYAFSLILPLVIIILFSLFAEFIGKLIGTLIFAVFVILIFLLLIPLVIKFFH
ncbi:hypothetical protein CN326_18395 [Bacillus sp. AFS018417]|uniref:hypothetical protein n=1 Tax=Bacillus sp. AFS018417 TaxID=2033491 RepID=UPI000BF6240E|nr:hypothetical protein [Bacillus sp. AFS018417]PEZ03300.1 hypothetical protein CN326_18395 [Bacillus sp. AFS018417]